MTPELFRRFCALANDHAGLNLQRGKEAMVAARVGKRVRALGLKSAAAYLERLEADGSGEELAAFLGVITTSFTGFFREPEHFDILARAAAVWARRRTPVRVWSAAVASGEEAYSIAMTLATTLGEDGDWRVLGTDISAPALAEAGRAVYAAERLGSIHPTLRRQFLRLQRRGRDAGATFAISPRLRRHVAFGRLNLAGPPFRLRGGHDAIFCRNVMIYLTAEVRAELGAELARLLRPGGLLFLAHSETLADPSTELELVGPSVRMRPGDPLLRAALAEGKERRATGH